MSFVDNSDLVAHFVPLQDDGDTFIYTEMLDRSKRKGNNGMRLMKTFYHRSRDEFWEQWPTIKQLCDMANVRACTRLSPRSFKRVGAEFTKLVVEASLTDNWQGMKTLYNRACGIAPSGRVWLFDVDKHDDNASKLQGQIQLSGNYLGQIPSRRAYHIIAKPFDPRCIERDAWPKDGYVFPNVQLHKDNPTNLYIPEGAA